MAEEVFRCIKNIKSHNVQGYYQRHLLQAFPSGLDEAIITNSALQLQRTTCTSSSNCFSGADCINGFCSCRSPFVETKGQVRMPLGFLSRRCVSTLL